MKPTQLFPSRKTKTAKAAGMPEAAPAVVMPEAAPAVVMPEAAPAVVMPEAAPAVVMPEAAPAVVMPETSLHVVTTLPEQYRVQVQTKTVPFREILRFLRSNTLTLPPSAGLPQQINCQIVENCILQIPLPPLFCAVEESGMMTVVHGKGILQTLLNYTTNLFALDQEHLRILKQQLGNRYYRDIEPARWGHNLRETPVLMHVFHQDMTAPQQREVVLHYRTMLNAAIHEEAGLGHDTSRKAQL